MTASTTTQDTQAFDQMRTANETLSFSHTDKKLNLNELEKEFASMTRIEQELRKSRTFRQAVGKRTILSIPYTRRRLLTYLAMRVMTLLGGCLFLFQALLFMKAFFEIDILSSVAVESQFNQIFYPTTGELSPLVLGTVFLFISLISFVCALITHFQILYWSKPPSTLPNFGQTA